MGKSPSPCETISLWPHNSLAGLDVKAATEAVTQNPCGNIFPYFQTCLDFCINAGEIKPFFFLYLLYLDDRTHEFVKKKTKLSNFKVLATNPLNPSMMCRKS